MNIEQKPKRPGRPQMGDMQVKRHPTLSMKLHPTTKAKLEAYSFVLNVPISKIVTDSIEAYFESQPDSEKKKAQSFLKLRAN
jgi:hypothetical protein